MYYHPPHCCCTGFHKVARATLSHLVTLDKWNDWMLTLRLQHTLFGGEVIIDRASSVAVQTSLVVGADQRPRLSLSCRPAAGWFWARLVSLGLPAWQWLGTAHCLGAPPVAGCCCLHTSPTVDRGQGRGHYSGPSSVTAVRDDPTSCLLSLNSLLSSGLPLEAWRKRQLVGGGKMVTVGPGTLTIVRHTCEWAADT